MTSVNRAEVEKWIADDPDPTTRAELVHLLALDAGVELADRFAGRLRFGTAGLRGQVGAGPNRMNRAVVRTATAALAGWLADHSEDARERGVAVGCDARHGSSEFADEVISVLAGAGFRVHALERQRPTPLLAFAVRHLGAAAGVMITASHNPAPDNGYKLYLDDGAQIVPPIDAEIERRMEMVGPLNAVPTAPLSDPLVTIHGQELDSAYVSALGRLPLSPPDPSLRIVYTPIHGVARGLFESALAAAGYPAPMVVQSQADPDPEFPTAPFPNPEEPGVMDLALADAAAKNADIVIAQDPDGDRMAVAVPDPSRENGWRILTGNQVGALLGAYVLETTSGPGRLVVTTVVSSSMLSKVAEASGAMYAETLTGFKWIVRAGDDLPGSHFVFGYEEALGYSVGTVVRDKDGIGSSLAFLAMTSRARTSGHSVLDLWDGLEQRHGVHLTSQLSVRSATPAASLARLRGAPVDEIAGRKVLDVEDRLPETDLLILRFDGAWIALRPSGTEPKLKVYIEVIRKPRDGRLGEARAEASHELSALLEGIGAVVT